MRTVIASGRIEPIRERFSFDEYQRGREYERATRAAIVAPIVTHNGEQDLPQGLVVAILSGEVHHRHPLLRRKEPLFHIAVNGEYWGIVWASQLANFRGRAGYRDAATGQTFPAMPDAPVGIRPTI